MKILINNEESAQEIRKLTIEIDEKIFRISVNQFNQVVVQKSNFGEGESDLIIRPSVSNEIRIE